MKTDAQNSPIRVSVVEPSGQLYGSELALLDILERLDPSRFQVEVILPRNAAFAASLRKAQIRSISLLPPRLQQCPRWRKNWSYLRLAWHWRQHRPDLIYVNQGGILRPVAALARRLQLPIVCQVQTLEDANWVSALTSHHNQVMAFICNSRFVSAATRVPSERLCAIYYGYKHKGLAASNRQAFDFNRPLLVGLLGRICRSKGHPLLVQAAARLKNLAPGQFLFRFIGDALNPEELAAVQTQIAHLGVAELFEFRGYRSNITAELASLDVLVIPSVAEPFGRIFCESAEAGVPALVADSGGLGELSRRFQVGVRFRGGDSNDLARQLESIRADYPAIASCFKSDAQQMLAALNLSDYIAKIEELLTCAAAGKPTSIEWLGSTAKEEFSSASVATSSSLS